MEDILEDGFSYAEPEDEDDYYYREAEYQNYYGDDFSYHSNELNYYEEEYDAQDRYNDYYDDYAYNRITLSELADQCIFPTLSQATYTVYPLLGLCFLTRVLAYVSNESKSSDHSFLCSPRLCPNSLFCCSLYPYCSFFLKIFFMNHF